MLHPARDRLGQAVAVPPDGGRVEPAARSRTATSSWSPATSAYSETFATPACLAALVSASPAAAATPRAGSSSGQVPTVTSSTDTPKRSSTSAAAARSAPARSAGAPASGP